MRNVGRALLFGAALWCSGAASPVSWGDYSTLFSMENETNTRYDLSALRVSGTLHVLQNTTYSLSFRGGRVHLGRANLPTGCHAGVLRTGDVLTFRGASNVQLHMPSRTCPR